MVAGKQLHTNFNFTKKNTRVKPLITKFSLTLNYYLNAVLNLILNAHFNV